jgi:hypothetical protein
MTQSSANWIAPYVGYQTWGDVKAKILKKCAQAPAGTPLFFNGDIAFDMSRDADENALAKHSTAKGGDS